MTEPVPAPSLSRRGGQGVFAATRLQRRLRLNQKSPLPLATDARPFLPGDVATQLVQIDSRPSDAIALASGLGTPIFVDETVFEQMNL